MSEQAVTIFDTHWRIQVREPKTDAYLFGGKQLSLEGAEAVVEHVLKPRLGRRDGFRKRTQFALLRYETLCREEKVL